MTQEFKIGDKVKVIKALIPSEESYVGRVGIITEEQDYLGKPAWGIRDFLYVMAEEQLELVSENKNNHSFMASITNAFKKFLSPDLQIQVKASFRNGGLELTEEGRTVAIEALLASNKEASDAFTQAANDKVAEEEKARN